METMEQFAPSESPVWAPKNDGNSDEFDRLYENVRLIGVDQDKLVALCDAVLFYVQVARLRTRPVTITEAEGCVEIRWSKYAPAVFRRNRLLALVAGGELIDHLTVQESIAA
ncbi:MAG: hypothetical protein WD696_07305 [Bryobacteraceae bacterium]